MKYVAIGAHLHRDDLVEGATAFPVEALTLSAFAIDDDRPSGDRDLLLEVARVRARLLERATFVAIRYGVIVANADDAAAKCAAFLPRWRELLTAHRDQVEMTLKIPVAVSEPRPERRNFARGADYLKALYRSRGSANADPDLARAAEELLGGLAVSWKWLPRDTGSVEMVLLVRRDDLDAVRAAGLQLRERAGARPFLLSGPWPLEAFADG